MLEMTQREKQLVDEVIFWRSIAKKMKFLTIFGWLYAFVLMAVIIYMD